MSTTIHDSSSWISSLALKYTSGSRTVFLSKQSSQQEDVTDVSKDDTEVSEDDIDVSKEDTEVSEDAMDDCEVPESDLDLTPWL